MCETVTVTGSTHGRGRGEKQQEEDLLVDVSIVSAAKGERTEGRTYRVQNLKL